MNVRFRKKC